MDLSGSSVFMFSARSAICVTHPATAATRLSAARREQRFAAMRLVGATLRQVSLIAAVESAVAAIGGVAVGFGLFFLLRVPLSAIPFTGQPFFPAQMSLSVATGRRRGVPRHYRRHVPAPAAHHRPRGGAKRMMTILDSVTAARRRAGRP
jgi:hypothetical protein